ncbi:hypothetical protein HPB50_004931 [Hyalomma asiaticum]|uniref:Uncharacterized protein n=1 Tax=Hyalomma asiaticum TaxID=266040 RepID=A0ACB7SNC0_HYAAI|nr:hypothetical protein HPB50_004931 [Hyalomma asiaticum]
MEEEARRSDSRGTGGPVANGNENTSPNNSQQPPESNSMLSTSVCGSRSIEHNATRLEFHVQAPQDGSGRVVRFFTMKTPTLRRPPEVVEPKRGRIRTQYAYAAAGYRAAKTL